MMPVMGCALAAQVKRAFALWPSTGVVILALSAVACSSTTEQKAQQDHQATQAKLQTAADQLYAAQRSNPVVKLDPVARFTGKTVA